MSPKTRCSSRGSITPCMAKTVQSEAQDTVDLMFRAFSDRTRLRILHVLRGGELCVGDIVEILRAPQPRVSRHLAFLRKAKLVLVRKQGEDKKTLARKRVIETLEDTSGAITPWLPPRRSFTASCWSAWESVSPRCLNSRPTRGGRRRSENLVAVAPRLERLLDSVNGGTILSPTFP